MSEIVNLRLARKRRDRSAKEEVAAKNRLAFGETKAEREHKRLLADKAVRHLDAHKLDPQHRARDDTH
ncbi:protein of unknown function [Rhizobiales bacterium GAS191]|jgi:hypothetical protein|nr:protein of unknown function [Rhizobiales bacterium GAS113]SEC35131.1 protein of unknown function [Rhizobiales bacterium GAS191]